MSRGLGERQREVLGRLRELDDEYGGWVPLHRLADDPGDADSMMRARSAVRGLVQRGLVAAGRMTDESRLVDTTVIVAEIMGPSLAQSRLVHHPVETFRYWSGLHVHLIDQDEAALQRDWARGALADLADSVRTAEIAP